MKPLFFLLVLLNVGLALWEWRKLPAGDPTQAIPPPAPLLLAEEAIKAGKLREDLSNHLAGFVIHLPPLRDRPEDILPLALSFLTHFAAQANRTIRGFACDAVERLTKHNWPGNTRQLQQEIQSAVLLCQGDEIQAADLFAPMACVRDHQSRSSDSS